MNRERRHASDDMKEQLWERYREQRNRVKKLVREEKGRYERKIAVKVESCLLYTSPSPRDKRQSRMPSSA